MKTLDVANAMIKHGGSFVEALGRALLLADSDNAQRIKKAFPSYWGVHAILANIDKTKGRASKDDQE